MLGVHERRNRNTLSTGSMAVATMAASNNMAVIGEVPLVNFYNDGSRSAWGGRDRRAVVTAGVVPGTPCIKSAAAHLADTTVVEPMEDVVVCGRHAAGDLPRQAWRHHVVDSGCCAHPYQQPLHLHPSLPRHVSYTLTLLTHSSLTIPSQCLTHLSFLLLSLPSTPCVIHSHLAHPLLSLPHSTGAPAPGRRWRWTSAPSWLMRAWWWWPSTSCAPPSAAADPWGAAGGLGRPHCRPA
jgi:hypothetical protein